MAKRDKGKKSKPRADSEGDQKRLGKKEYEKELFRLQVSSLPLPWLPLFFRFGAPVAKYHQLIIS
jgi:hypothetical protein